MALLEVVKTIWAPLITIGTGVWFFAQLDSRVSLAEQKLDTGNPVVTEQIRRVQEDIKVMSQSIDTIQTNQVAVCLATNAKCHY